MKNIFLITFFFLCYTIFGQNEIIKAQFYSKTDLFADEFVGINNFEDVFFINDNVFYKKKGAITLQYQNNLLGKITKVDIINPLKIVVFYEDFNSVILLDNQLNEIQKINFSELENPIIVSAIGMSGQNKLWFFNVSQQQIALFDLATNLYTNLNVPIREPFTVYNTDFNYFHWINANNELESCSIYGKVYLTKNLNIIENLQIINLNTILYTNQNKVMIEDFKIQKVYQIVNIEESVKKIFYKDQILTIFTKNEIINYKITIP